MFFKFLILLYGKKFIKKLKNLELKYRIYKKYSILIGDNQIITNPDNIHIGKLFAMSPFCQLLAQGIKGDALIKIGNNVAFNYNVMINADCNGKIIIGNNVRIGPYTVMRASNHKIDNLDIPICEQGHLAGEIIIEDDVWLGAHVTVLPNVKIGTSSVVAAGSVVTKDISPYSIAGGVPAKLIKFRNTIE